MNKRCSFEKKTKGGGGGEKVILPPTSEDANGVLYKSPLTFKPEL